MSTSQDITRGRSSGANLSGQQGLASHNVGESERVASMVAGAALALLGLKRGSISGLGIAALGGMLVYRGYKGQCSVYQKLGLNTAKAAEPSEYFDHGIHVEVSTTINRPAAELYTFWRNFENLPQFMDHLQSVTVLDDKRSNWVAKGPAGTSVKWDAEIINDVPNDTIAWRSLAGAQVDNAGSVRFLETAGGSTEVHVVLDYIPPGRTLGKWVAKLFGEDPQTQIKEDLRKFKRLMEGDSSAASGGQMGSSGSSQL